MRKLLIILILLAPSLALATVPFPVTGHPRLWVNQSDVARLQSWAVSSNPVYQNGMVPLLAQAVNLYTTQYFPGGTANSSYPDNGDTQGYAATPGTEQVAVVLAFNSMIDPNSASRIQYAQYARNLLMHAMSLSALGHSAGAPFRDPAFATGNRANGTGEQWPLIVDWIYSAVDGGGNPILTDSDKATIRNVFMIWANDCLNAATTGGDHPTPIGVVNDPQLLPDNKPYRMASNNYYLGHSRLLTMMALSIDPADDPVVGAGPDTQLGNTLRSYILNANGAWLYQIYAMMGEPAAVASAYGISGNGAGFGLTNGGLPPEGMLYGHSYGYLLGQLMAMQTAGFNSTGLSGPQAQLIGSPVWDRYVSGFISSLVPAAQTFDSKGPVYQYGSYGDLLRLWVTPEFMQSFALLALLDQKNGKTANLNAARWFAVNAVEGGASALATRVSDSWSYSATSSILYFMLLDPAASPATDPRSSYPLAFVDPSMGRVVAHNDWSANGTMFDYRASWNSINHQLGDGGQFEFYRKGEWLTKELSNYDSNGFGMTTVYHNTLALKNLTGAGGTPSNLGWYETGEWSNGSQWVLGLGGGDPSTVIDTGSNYVYAASDLTNLYNRPDQWVPSNAANNITKALRSVVWLNNDFIVVYDRATSLNTGLFKRFNLCLTNNPSISGNTVTETLTSGQKLFVQTLLPSSPSLSASDTSGALSSIAQLEPSRYTLTVEDASNPTDVTFLHVLQGADSGTGMASASTLTSANMQGAFISSSQPQIVLFPKNGVQQSSVSYTASYSSGVTGNHLITGLQPHYYKISRDGVQIATATASSQGVLSFSATGGTTFDVVQITVPFPLLTGKLSGTIR